MSNNPFIGRKDAVGVGLETTAGTGVAPQAWQRHLSLSLDQKTTQAQNNSAMGRVEDINDSAVTEEWAEGSVNGKITDITIGYILANIFGSVSAAAHPSETLVYDNTFTVNQNQQPNPLTFSRVNPVASRRYALGMLTDFELDIKTGGWVQFTSTFVSKTGATSSDTVAFTNENEFTSKHVTVKVATNIAGLSGATALQLKELKLKISRKANRFVPFGAIDPATFDTESWGVTGTMVLRYTDTTLETLALANTRQAMSVALVNTDTTIGTSSNPSLTFTAPKVRLTPITLDNNLDQVLNQTVAFTAELDVVLAYMMQAVLTNTQNGYAHV
jgi:hypothetical protein